MYPHPRHLQRSAKYNGSNNNSKILSLAVSVRRYKKKASIVTIGGLLETLIDIRRFLGAHLQSFAILCVLAASFTILLFNNFNYLIIIIRLSVSNLIQRNYV